MPKYFLVTHPWEQYRKTLEYLCFESEGERKPLSQGDLVVYCSSGLVAGIFEVEKFVEKEFTGSADCGEFQVKIKPVALPEKDLVARPFRYKESLEKPIEGSPRIFPVNTQDFGKTLIAIREKKKELVL